MMLSRSTPTFPSLARIEASSLRCAQTGFALVWVLETICGPAVTGGAFLHAYVAGITIGFGVSRHSLCEHRLITRKELDQACRDVPLILIGYDGHSCICNSAFVDRLPTDCAELKGFNAEIPPPSTDDGEGVLIWFSPSACNVLKYRT